MNKINKSVKRRLAKNDGKSARIFTVVIKAEFGNPFQMKFFDQIIVGLLKTIKTQFEKAHPKNKIKIEVK